MDNNTIVKNILDKLWASVIESMDIDILRNQITFRLTNCFNETLTHYILRFLSVSSFYYINAAGDMRFNMLEYEDGDFLELSSICYYPKGIGEIDIKQGYSWTKQCCSSANYALEIWQKSFLIEAKQIEIVNVDEGIVLLRH